MSDNKNVSFIKKIIDKIKINIMNDEVINDINSLLIYPIYNELYNKIYPYYIIFILMFVINIVLLIIIIAMINK